MRPIIPVREWPDDQFYPPRWRIRTYELSIEHTSEAPDLGRVFGGVSLRLKDRIHAQGKNTPKQTQVRGDFSSLFFSCMHEYQATDKYSRPKRNLNAAARPIMSRF